MTKDLIANLEALLAKGGDGAALRLALAARYLDGGDALAAVRHAQAAVRLDPEYSAAWKALGQALTAAERNGAAISRPRKKCASSASACSALSRSRKPMVRTERLSGARGRGRGRRASRAAAAGYRR